MSVVHELLCQIEEKENLQYFRQPAPVETTTDNGLFVFDLPKEIINDFYGLKEYVRIANRGGNVRVLSITSSTYGEGASTIATYLSFLMAGGLVKQPAVPAAQQENNSLFNDSLRALVNHNRKSNVVPMDNESSNSRFSNRDDILLIDANLEQPGLHRYFGLPDEMGLGEIIEQNQDWKEYVRSVDNSNLKIITAGSAESKSIELLSSDRFRALVRQWRNTFKYVIIDTPPVLNSIESLSIASVSDGVILIVCAGQTRWENAQTAKMKLMSAKANVLGVALNRRKMDIPDGLYKRLVS